MIESNVYIEMKWKWRKEAESEEQRMSKSVMHREAEDEIIALFYYLLLLNLFITHTQFIYVVLEDTIRRIFFLLHTISMLTESPFVTRLLTAL
jgi:hypothetical protein